ncbi:MAG: 50S ribosomal protein L4 [Candidatus Omnitrophica bacterium]|nr:50S ribosomal protein L4 [Candidatus Omnitrophota bacterium]
MTKEQTKGLDPNIFDGKVNKAVLYHVIKMYEANKRRGTTSTKTRAVVSGGGRKPWRQKGTGRARAGSIRSPLWKGGGTIFGPHPRDYSYNVGQKLRVEALKSSLNSKHNEKAMVIVEDVKIEKPKTKEFKKLMDSLKLNEKALFVLDKIDENLRLASRNLKDVALRRADDLNALDVLKYNRLVVTKAALQIIEKRLKG